MEKVNRKELIKQIGVGVVAIGLGIGSGEFILWPYLSYHFGFGLLWGALLGIVMQIILNIEIQRYAFVSGNSLVKGAYQLAKKFGFWFIFSTLLGFGWPGFAASSGYLFSNAFGFEGNTSIVAVFVLILAGVVLLAGKNIYQRIEKLLKIIIPISFVVILIIFIRYFDITLFKEMLTGIVGQYSAYNLIPSNLNIAILLGAIVYAGSGGNLLLSQAYYVLEKKKLSNDFQVNRKFQIFENIFVFGGIGLTTILMLSYLGRALTYQVSAIYNDITFIGLQAGAISVDMGTLFATLYLLAGAFALFSVQLGVLDLLGRVCMEVFGLRYGKTSHQIYVISIVIQIMFGTIILLSGASQPLWLIVIGSIFNALAMGVIALITLILNMQLKKEFQPSMATKVLMVLISVFYISFFVITLISNI